MSYAEELEARIIADAMTYAEELEALDPPPVKVEAKVKRRNFIKRGWDRLWDWFGDPDDPDVSTFGKVVRWAIFLTGAAFLALVFWPITLCWVCGIPIFIGESAEFYEEYPDSRHWW